MKTTKTLIAAAAIAFAGSAATAGGLGPTVVVVDPPEAVETSSLPAGYIVLGLLAALVAASGSF